MSGDRPGMPRCALLVVCGLGVGTWVAGALVQPPGVDLVRHVALFSVSFASYLASVALLLSPQGRHLAGRSALVAIIAWAIVLRLLLLNTAPSLSDDVYRYVWDGRVANAGVSPYAHPPSSPDLAGLRDPVWSGINHKEMYTPYPPLAEALFAIAYRLRPDSVTAMQGMAVVFDVGVIALLVSLLSLRGMEPSRVLIYAWNPLVLVQFAHSGHFDAAMLAPLLAAILALSGGRRLLSGALLGVSTLVKLVPAIAIPVFLPLWGVPGIVGVVAVGAVGALPLLGTPALAGVVAEASDARFNESMSFVLLRLFSLVTPDPETPSRSASAGLLLVGSFALANQVWRRGESWQAVLRWTYVLVGLFVLSNAVVEPWYLTWIVPFLCFVLPRAGERWWTCPSLGWLLLSGTIVLTDLTYVRGFPGSGWVWIRLIEYAPLYLLLGVWAWGLRARVLPRSLVAGNES